MDIVKTKATDRRRLRQKRPGLVIGVLNLKKTAQPSAAERQIAEVERTFSDRWEW